MKYLLPLLLLVSAIAVAQEVEVPRYELSTGYSYGDVDYATTTAYGLSPRGFVGSFSTNLRSWVAAEAEVGGQYQNENFSVAGVPYSMNAGFYSFLGGPRVAYRRGRTSPFVHTLFGLARTIAYDKATVNATSGTAFFPYENGLGVLIGGGMDYRVSRHVSMRTQADYFVTQPNGGLGAVTQNNFRLVGGLVFNFGGMTGYSVAKDRSLPPAPAAAQPPAEQPPAESYQLEPRPQSQTESMSAADDSKSAAPAPAPAPAASAVAAAPVEQPASESAPPITSWSASQKSKTSEPEPEDSAPAAGITAAPASPETPAAATAQPATAPSQPAAMQQTFPATPRVVTTETTPAAASATVGSTFPATPHVVTTVATPASQPTVMTAAPSTPAVLSTATPAPTASPAPNSSSAPGTAGVWPAPATPPTPATPAPATQAAAKPAASAPAPAAVQIAPAQQDTVIAGYDPGSSVTSQPQEESLGDVARRYRAEKKRRQQLEKEHQAAQAPLAQ